VNPERVTNGFDLAPSCAVSESCAPSGGPNADQFRVIEESFAIRGGLTSSVARRHTRRFDRGTDRQHTTMDPIPARRLLHLNTSISTLRLSTFKQSTTPSSSHRLFPARRVLSVAVRNSAHSWDTGRRGRSSMRRLLGIGLAVAMLFGVSAGIAGAKIRW